MFKRSTFLALSVVFLLAGTLTACTGQSQTIKPKYDVVCAIRLFNQCDATGNPVKPVKPTVKDGWVNVFKDLNQGDYTHLRDLQKRCDGSTLIYSAFGNNENSISTIPNSPECTVKKDN